MEVVEIACTMRLGGILIERGLITEAQLNQSLAYQRESGARLGEALVELGHVTPDQINAALTWQEKYGLSALTELVPNPSAVVLLTERFARMRQVLPLQFTKTGALMLAMVNPTDVLTIDDVRLITGVEVVPVLTTSGVLNEALDHLYMRKGRLGDAAENEDAEETPGDREVAGYASVVSLVDEILAMAMRQKASDVHFEPQADAMVVRLRIDGVLHRLTEIHNDIKHGVVSRIKILADMDIAEKRLPQDGRATFYADDRSMDLRIATCPTVFGENVTVRLLDDRMLHITLEQLGMGEEELPAFRKALKRPYGEILVILKST